MEYVSPALSDNGKGDISGVACERSARKNGDFRVVFCRHHVNACLGLRVVVAQIVLEWRIKFRSQGRGALERENVWVVVVVDFVVCGDRRVRNDAQSVR